LISVSFRAEPPEAFDADQEEQNQIFAIHRDRGEVDPKRERRRQKGPQEQACPEQAVVIEGSGQAIGGKHRLGLSIPGRRG
jgi:hypothetical protein